MGFFKWKGVVWVGVLGWLCAHHWKHLPHVGWLGRGGEIVDWERRFELNTHDFQCFYICSWKIPSQPKKNFELGDARPPHLREFLVPRVCWAIFTKESLVPPSQSLQIMIFLLRGSFNPQWKAFFFLFRGTKSRRSILVPKKTNFFWGLCERGLERFSGFYNHDSRLEKVQQKILQGQKKKNSKTSFFVKKKFSLTKMQNIWLRYRNVAVKC